VDPAFVQGLMMYTVLLVSLVIHEASHAVTAMWCGDNTAKDAGLVTLNPMPHIRRSTTGMVIMPLIILVMSHGRSVMGGASVPIDAGWAYRNPRKAGLVSAAGPLSNFLLVLLAVLVMKFMLMAGKIQVDYTAFSPMKMLIPRLGGSDLVAACCKICSTFIFLNLLLGMLNLIPVPPLDGSGVISGIFPATRRLFDAIANYQTIVMIVVLLAVFRYGWEYLLPAFVFAISLV
jgi:Zn-dependent protease